MGRQGSFSGGQEGLLVRGCQSPSVLTLLQCGLWELGPTYTWSQNEAEGGWSAHSLVIGLEVEPSSHEPGVVGSPQELEERGWVGITLMPFQWLLLGFSELQMQTNCTTRSCSMGRFRELRSSEQG